MNEASTSTDLQQILPFIALGFIALVLTEGGFSFLSGRFAALTAEGIARKIRNYLLRPYPANDVRVSRQDADRRSDSRVTSDVDAVRRFYQEQAIGVAAHLTAVPRELYRALDGECAAGALVSVVVVPI